MEARARDTVEWTNMELERNVRVMERSVQQLEAGIVQQLEAGRPKAGSW